MSFQRPCPLPLRNHPRRFLRLVLLPSQFRRRLSELKLIPDEEWDDGLILAETSLADIPMLVTSDRHLLDIDEDALLMAFNEADLPPVRPAHPKRLVKALR